MRRFFTVAAIVSISLLAISCASRIHYPRQVGDSPPAPVPHTERQFTYQKQDNPFSATPEWRTDQFTISEFSMASIGDNGQEGNLITARYYQSKQPARKPLIIIMPIWGVHTLPSDKLAAHIAKNGDGAVNVFQLHGWNRLLDLERAALAPTSTEFSSLIDQMADRVTNMVIDIRRIVDWAETQPDIDPDKIALAGFSLSAMVASVALTNEPRLSAGVLVMGSASPHDSFTVCGGAAGQMRKMVTKRFKWSREQYRAALKRGLTRVDPARFPGRVDPRHILIIEAGNDTCLPAAARQKLWEVMGRPARIVYQYDHRTAFMAMTFLGGRSLQKEIFMFLRKVFGIGKKS